MVPFCGEEIDWQAEEGGINEKVDDQQSRGEATESWPGPSSLSPIARASSCGSQMSAVELEQQPVAVDQRSTLGVAVPTSKVGVAVPTTESGQPEMFTNQLLLHLWLSRVKYVFWEAPRCFELGVVLCSHIQDAHVSEEKT